MSIELWLAFVVASTVVLMVPGPTIILVVSYALTRGRRTARYTVPGVALGDLAAMTASLAGVGALLATSATVFTVVKLAGAAYLVWLGIKMWRSPAEGDIGGLLAEERSGRRMLVHAFTVTALNPKSIAFFIAFLPQFIDGGTPVLPQMLLLGGTFLVLAPVNAALYAVLAGSIRPLIRRPGVLKTLNRVSGSALIGAGLMTAALRRVG